MNEPEFITKARAEGRILRETKPVSLPPVDNVANTVVPAQAKYRNQKTEVCGLKFDSKKEANRYLELRFMEGQGRIRNLILQQRIPIIVNKQIVCRYVADFVYEEREGQSWRLVTEDVKSEITRKNPVYRLKKKLLAAACGRQIREV